MGDTYTEEELKAAVDKAVADATSALQAKLTELENSLEKSEIDKAVAAVKAEADEKIKELETKLDAAVIEATKAKEEKEAQDKFWADAIAETEEKAAREARREERMKQLAEVAHFPEEFLKENEERFVAMSDEEFTARLEEYKAQREALDASNGAGGSTPPVSTALTAARTTTTTTPTSALREVLGLRRAGVDPRRVRS